MTSTDPLLPGEKKPVKPVFVPTFDVEPFDDGAIPMPFDDGGVPIINDDDLMFDKNGLPIDPENPNSSPLTDDGLPPSEENEARV